MDLKRHIGARVKSARRDAGLTQAGLAELLDRAVETISNIERGHALPGIDTLARIAALTEVAPVYFLEGLPEFHGESPRRAQQEAEANSLVRGLSDAELTLALRIIRAIKR
ncbi:helix-turn-helix domain-containing protein [Microvirga flavescens]|uniref:helix-turn-helix domain-containing protein n=1 Tax=Microvirga flavescens TaxID=2249811 RepID=UPI0013006C3E|nr:helix-turn-helix transcriptional regulator [Microvirga flavescens]